MPNHDPGGANELFPGFSGSGREMNRMKTEERVYVSNLATLCSLSREYQSMFLTEDFEPDRIPHELTSEVSLSKSRRTTTSEWRLSETGLMWTPLPPWFYPIIDTGAENDLNRRYWGGSLPPGELAGPSKCSSRGLRTRNCWNIHARMLVRN